jgi:hypothetical protein
MKVSVDLRPRFLDRVVAELRTGPFQGRWLFGWVFLAQFGHLIEHIAKQLTGSGLLGTAFDSEASHLVFNSAVAVMSILLVLVYPRNPWVYPLCALSLFHGIEHVYIFQAFLKTGVSNGPGLLGLGGVIGLIPLDRLDLHNVYNGFEMIFLVLGLWNETEILLTQEE